MITAVADELTRNLELIEPKIPTGSTDFFSDETSKPSHIEKKSIDEKEEQKTEK